MDLNITFDAGGVGGDDLNRTRTALQQIKALVESTEPFGTHLAKGSKVEIDGLMAQMRNLARSMEGDLKRVETAMKSAAPVSMRQELERVSTTVRKLAESFAEANRTKVKFEGAGGSKAFDQMRTHAKQLEVAITNLGSAYGKLAMNAANASRAAADATARSAYNNLASSMTPVRQATSWSPQAALRAAGHYTQGVVGPSISDSLLDARNLSSQVEVRRALANDNKLTAAATREAAKAAGEGIKPARDLTNAMSQQLMSSKDLHSAYRGLASGFGAMWLTWGNALPLLTGAAISHSMNNAVRQGAEFGNTLTAIGALGEISAEGVQKLNDAVLDMAGKSVYGPQEMAEALKSLALAGLNVEEQLAGLPAVLDFARTGERPLKDAAEDLVAISTAFGMTADDFNKVGDIVTKTAAASMASVTDMSAAFRTSSSLATLYKVELQDVALGLALMAQNGIRGQSAGTALRQMYVELTGTTKKTTEALKTLNIEIFDNMTNQVKSLPAIVKEVSKALEGMSFKDQMKTLQDITNERGMRALGILLQSVATEAKKAGKDVSTALDEMLAEISKADGFMREASDRMDDSTSAAFSKIAGTIQGQFIKAFQDAEPEVRRVLQSIHDLLASPAMSDALSNLIQLTAMLLDGFIKLDDGVLPLAGSFKSVGEMMDEAAGYALIAKAAIAQLSAEVRAALGQIGALLSFDFSMIPKIKEMHDADTDARRQQLAADLQRIANRGRERQDREAMRAAMERSKGSSLADQANAGLDAWAANRVTAGGGGGGGSPNPPRTYTGGGGRSRRPRNQLADETRDLQKAQADLQAMKEEVELLRTFPDAYEKMSAAKKKMLLIDIQLRDGTVDGARKLTAAEVARKKEERAVLAQVVSNERLRDVLVEEQKKREEVEKSSTKRTQSLISETLELEAANAAHDKGKVAVGESTLALMEHSLAMGESVMVGKEMIQATEEMVTWQKRYNAALREAEWKAYDKQLKGKERDLRDAVETQRAEYALMGRTSTERARANALMKIDLDLRRQIEELNEKEMSPSRRAEGRARLEMMAQQNRELVIAQQEFERLDGIVRDLEQGLESAFMNSIENWKLDLDGFKDVFKSFVRELVLRPLVMNLFINPIMGAVGGLFGMFGGGGAASANGVSPMGVFQNAGSLSNMYGLASNWLGFGTGAGSGTLALGNAASLMGGDGLGTFIAANGGWGTSGGGAFASSMTSLAPLAAIAAPIIVGMLAERNSRDRYGGAAYATSNWQSDAFVNAVGDDFNALTGDIPNREALIERAITAGIERSTVDLFQGNDRALLHYVRMAEDPSRNEFGGLPDPRKLIADGNLYNADFYRGQGFASPEEMGWWNNKGGDLTAVDPRVVEASRALSLSIVAPLSDMARMLGDAEADFRVTTGFANRGKGAMWGALDIQRGGESIGGFGQGDFANVQEYMRAVYSEAMDAFSAMDLPEWARGQVEGAQTAMGKLDAEKLGDKLGEEAAALYQQTTDGIAQMYQSIQTLIDVFPDFANATQGSLHGLQELMGGMDQLQFAYSSYIGAFWAEDERRELMTAQLTAQLAELGQTMPTTREEFRGMVEAALAAGESGNALAAALLGMSGAMSEVLAEVDAAAEAAQALAAAKQRTDDVWQQLQTLLAEQIGNWRTLANEAKSIFDMATSAARDLRGDVSSTREWEAARSNAMIDQALAAARASGALPDADDLRHAIAGARAGLDMDGYASVAEYERDQLVLAGKLAELGDVAGGQMSFAEQQVRLLEEQRDYWKKQIDQLRRTDLTITSIDEGVTYLADTLRAEHAAQAAAAAEVEAQSSAARVGKGVFGGGGYSSRGPIDYAAEAARLKEQEWYGRGNWNRVIGWSLGGVAAATGISPDDLEKYLKTQGLQVAHGGMIIPKFDVGTNYVPRDMLAHIHEGEAIVPKAFNPWAKGAILGGGGGSGDEERLVTLLQAVLRELGAIRADTKEISDLEFKLVSLVRRVTGEGNAMRTQEVPA